MDRREFLAVATGTVGGCVGAPEDDAGSDSHPSDEEEVDRPADTPTASPASTDRGRAREADSTPTDAERSIGLEPIVEGLEFPVSAVESPEVPGRMYVAERAGVVRVSEPGQRGAEPLLDVSSQVLTTGERGLLGIALHPEFADIRRLFVRYSAPPREGSPDGYSHTFVLAEFEVEAGGLEVDPDTERAILEIPQPHQNHNAGDLAFGPDGHLYVPVGDGGHGDDRGPGHARDWYDGAPGGNGQDVTENLLGGVLRIDVDDDGGEKEYAIPDDNPLVGREGLDEYYAWGFRNPWRLSFDGDDLFVGDVGQRRWEEINLVEKGGNYGWNVKEGTDCFGVETYSVETCPDATPEDVRGGEPLLDPVVEYPNFKNAKPPVSGAAVVCGYPYDGSAIPDLRGRFVFADWVARGRLFVATPVDDGLWPTESVEVVEEDRAELYTATGFVRGPTVELSVLTTHEDGTGGVYRLVAADRRDRSTE